MTNMANQFLGLSLFIMLLAFFIILNSISSFEDTKSRPVLNSLLVAFSNREPVDLLPPGPMLQQTAAMNEGSTLDQVEELFRSQITSAETRQNRLGTIMYIRMPFEEFREAIEVSLSDAPRPKTNPLDGTQTYNMLPLLVSLLETQGGVAYKMDMILNIEEEPAVLVASEPEKFTAHNNDVSSIARLITQAGLPTHQISSGIQRGEAGVVNLVFRRYQPFNPLEARTLSQVAEDEAQEEAQENSQEDNVEDAAP